MRSILHTVKKVFAFFVVAVMLVQSVGAAVGGVCPQQRTNGAQHEQHFGHHGHADPANQVIAVGHTDASDSTGLTHDDCGACHLMHTPAVAMWQPAFAVAPAEALVIPAMTTSKADGLPSGIERPNWRT